MDLKKKLKSYLNQAERNIMIQAYALISALQEDMADWKERGVLSAEEDKYRKMGLTFLGKCVDSVVKRMDSGFAGQLVRDLKGTEIFCLPKQKAKNKMEEYQKERNSEIVECRRDAIEALAELALTGCRECNNLKQGCIAKQIFIELNIPVCDGQEPNPICPYYFKI